MLCNEYNLDENLPKNIYLELNEIYPIETSDMAFFLKNTEHYHGLFHWAYEAIKIQNERKIQNHEMSFLILRHKKAIEIAISQNENLTKLNDNIKTPFGSFSHVCKDLGALKKYYKKLYIKSLKVYLINKDRK